MVISAMGKKNKVVKKERGWGREGRVFVILNRINRIPEKVTVK